MVISGLGVQKKIRKLANAKVAKQSQYFFKTGKGEYGEGDIFLGVRTPELRRIAKDSVEIQLVELSKLISSKYHEERLAAVIILTFKYAKAKLEKEQFVIYNYYVRNLKFINNWDLIDVTCPHVIGKHLINRSRKDLYKWVKSPNMWRRRVGIVSSLWFLRRGDTRDVLPLVEILVNDPEDLIHKAVGWVLRELGKKDMKALESFLKRHYLTMPRTMLRYAIEKFPETKRKAYLRGQALS